jgi:hypothetical protein
LYGNRRMLARLILRAFEGKNQISVASAILEKDPDAITKIKPLSPAALDYLVATCMAKDCEERFQTVHDLRLQLKGISFASPSVALPTQRLGSQRTGLALIGIALLVIGAAIGHFLNPDTSTVSSVRSYILPPPGMTFPLSGLEIGPVDVSPDGKTRPLSSGWSKLHSSEHGRGIRQGVRLDGRQIGSLHNKHGYARGEHGHCGDRHDGPSQA